MGSMERNTSFLLMRKLYQELITFTQKFLWLSITPLALPVVPEV